MAEILRVYDEIFNPKLDYCVICLRSERQRRLVSTDNLEKFVKSINLPFGYRRTFQKICWVCDRHATAAFKFRLAVNVSASIHSLFELMGRSRRGYADAAAQLRGTRPVTPVTGVVRSADEWLSQLERIRARSTLLSTEVLVVASVPPRGYTDGDADEPTFPEVAASPPPREEYLLPDDAPPPSPPRPSPPLSARNDAEDTTNDLTEPEIFMEPFVIDDDERDPIEIKREESTDDITIEETDIITQSMQLNPPPSRPLTSNKTVPGSANSLPRTSNTPITNILPKPNIIPQISKEPQNPIIIPQTPTKIVNLEQFLDFQNDNTSFFLHPIVENNGMMSVPSLGAQIINGQLVTIDNSNIVIQTPRLALNNGQSVNLLSDPTQVTNYLKSINNEELSKISVVSNTLSTQTMENNIQRMHQNSIPNQQLLSQILESQQVQSAINATNLDIQNSMPNKSYSDNIIAESIVLDDDDIETDDVRKRQSTESGKRKRDTKKVEEEPPVKQRETDWEDKIPMDVISYIDATDPNPLLMETPLGVIAHVETLAETPVETTVSNKIVLNSLQDLLTRPASTPRKSSVQTNISGQSNSGQIKSGQSNSGQSNNSQIKSYKELSNISGQTNIRGLSYSGQKKVDYGPYSLFITENQTNSSDGANVTKRRYKRVQTKPHSGESTSPENVHINVFKTRDNKTVNTDDVIDLC